MTRNDKAVIALSVYNAVSLTGEDMGVAQVVEFLRENWSPASSRNARRVTVSVVAAAARRLELEGHAVLDGSTIRIPVRDPRTRFGRMLDVNYERGTLIPR